ncbi:FAS1-like dehydratase domain-containing protein [Haloarchaeobius sp. HRN-SO-5]|uniref:FAS1-like dehydratase domain-containing protein n=1 Tax=Haloarchaeobius sp. HRN-SO-5 TaxID=3446118 RepID=UPI003EB69637
MSTDRDGTDVEGFVGQTFEGSEFTVERWMAYLWADATENPDDGFRYPDDDGVQYVPPTFGQVVARQAAGIDDIEARLRGGDWADPNVFLGGQRFSFDRPLRVGETYRASAEITDLEEKSGSSGDFHVLTVAYTVETADGTPAYEMETDLVVQRPEADG